MAYATKAFLCLAMARLAHEEGLRLDVSTGGEMHVALSAGVPPDRLVLHGNNKSDDELAIGPRGRCGPHRRRLLRRDRPPRATGVRRRRRSGAQRPAPVLARVTPGVEVHTHEFVRTGQDDTKFGFGVASGAAADAVERLSELAAKGIVDFGGIHAHLGSQVFALAPFAQAIDVLAQFFAPLGLPELVVGGGLGVPYVNGEEAPPMAQWAASVRRRLPAGGHPRLGPGDRRAGAVHRGLGGHHPLPGGYGQGGARPPHLRVGRRGDERQPSPGPLRQRLRGLPAPETDAPRPGPSGWWASTARRVT